MQSSARLSATKPEAAARLLELIQMRLISQAIQVVAALDVADLLADAIRKHRRISPRRPRSAHNTFSG